MLILTPEANADLRLRVSQYMADRHMPGLKRVRIDAADGVVTLDGTVGSYYEKQLCQNICRRVAGVVRLIDNVNVDDNKLVAIAN